MKIDFIIYDVYSHKFVVGAGFNQCSANVIKKIIKTRVEMKNISHLHAQVRALLSLHTRFDT